MANLAVTSTTNSIKVDFQDTPFTDSRTGRVFNKGTWSKSEIGSIRLNDNIITINTKDELDWKVSNDGYEGTLTIDTVGGAPPSSLSDLYDKLIALIA